eukprot:scaffold94613_cov72-Attheya_sp.AAC.1
MLDGNLITLKKKFGGGQMDQKIIMKNGMGMHTTSYMVIKTVECFLGFQIRFGKTINVEHYCLQRTNYPLRAFVMLTVLDMHAMSLTVQVVRHHHHVLQLNLDVQHSCLESSKYEDSPIVTTNLHHRLAPFHPQHAYPIKCAKAPFKFALLPLDVPSSVISMDVLRVLVGLEMIDCRAIEAPYINMY